MPKVKKGRYLKLIKKHRHLFIVFAILVVAELCIQMLYPYDVSLPLARAGDTYMGLRPRDKLAAYFENQFSGAEVELRAGERAVVTPLAKLGVSLNADTMGSTLTEYPLWQRLIPLSLVAKWPQVKSLDLSMNGTKVASSTISLASQLSYDPTDATLSIKDNKLLVVAAKDGAAVTATDVRNALLQGTYFAGKTMIIVKSKVIQPTRSDKAIIVAKQQAELALARELVIKVEGKGDFKPDLATRASWLTIHSEASTASLEVNSEKIAQYVASVNDKVKTNAENSVITVIDGVEQGRTEGVAGATLDTDAIAKQLASSVINASQPASIPVKLNTLAPQTVYSSNYSHSQAGLRAYVAYATSTQNVRIVVQQLDGEGWSASGRADESIPSASTYKLYVLLRVFEDINNGVLTWDTPMLDTTAGGCFERTVVPSTNPCAEEWIRQYGRQYLTDYAHQHGFSNGTGFTFSDASHTTAGDLAKYLIGLYNGTLVGGNNRDMLLDKMGRQLYPYGIPRGVKGTVQDKVGFLWDYIHDAAIVHGPKGTYILVIMTKGYSYGYIANVARQIDQIMYP